MTSAPLDAENLDTYATPEGILLDTRVIGWIRASGYNIEDLHELHTAARDNSDTGHIVAKLVVSTKPSDDPEYDAVADKDTLWVCECGDYTHRKFPDIREFGNKPHDAGSCVHIESCDKSEKAANDKNQDTLL